MVIHVGALHYAHTGTEGLLSASRARSCTLSLSLSLSRPLAVSLSPSPRAMVDSPVGPYRWPSLLHVYLWSVLDRSLCLHNHPPHRFKKKNTRRSVNGFLITAPQLALVFGGVAEGEPGQNGQCLSLRETERVCLIPLCAVRMPAHTGRPEHCCLLPLEPGAALYMFCVVLTALC